MVGEVQGKILAMIANSDGLRYSEAYPGEGIDDDLYNYHLQELVRHGLLQKIDKTYCLTDEGKQEVTLLNHSGDPVEIFKIIVLLIVTRNVGRQILIHQRIRHPHRGEISTVSGKVRTGELFTQAAKRGLKEKTGLQADFSHWGDFRVIRKTQDGKLFEDIIFALCVAHNPTGDLTESNEYGQNWWAEFDQIYSHLDNNIATAKIEADLIHRIQKHQPSPSPMPEEVVILSQY
jgi:ADP-ribose pyrophosphatase YjhB (NUDIX family)